MNQPWVGWALGIAFVLSLATLLWLLSRPLTERERELDRRIKAKRNAPLSPMHLYVASGRVPTGRVAEILFEAEKSWQRREGRSGG